MTTTSDVHIWKCGDVWGCQVNVRTCFRFPSVFAVLRAYLKQNHWLCWCKVSGDDHVTKVSIRLYKGYMSQNSTNIQELKTLRWSPTLVFLLFVLLTSLCYLHVFSRRWDWYVGASLAVWYLSQWQDWGMRFPTFIHILPSIKITLIQLWANEQVSY